MTTASDAPTRRALVLFAHGARDPRWAAPFEAVATALRQQRPAVPVTLAYLELMAPSLPEAAAAMVAGGAQHIDVLPLFLGTGSHLRRDLPLLAEQLRLAHPGVAVTVHAAVGEHAALTQAMVAIASQLLEPPA